MKKIVFFSALGIGILLAVLLIISSKKVSLVQQIPIITNGEPQKNPQARINPSSRDSIADIGQEPASTKMVRGIESLSDDELLSFIEDLERIYQTSDPQEEQKVRRELQQEMSKVIDMQNHDHSPVTK